MKSLFLLLLFQSGCAVRKSSDLQKPASQILSAWKQIWKSPDSFSELRSFQTKYGLFLETIKKVQPLSYLNAEGACGETYVSLVTSDEELDEYVFEVDSSGKTLLEWHTGSGKVHSIQGSKLYREVSFFEDPNDYSIEKSSKGKSHSFVLAIGSAGSLEVIGRTVSLKKMLFKETACPKIDHLKSDYAYCVRDPASMRTFVFQRPCT